MSYFLVKTDPDTYSIDDLEHDGTTVWDGVRNPQALQVIRSMHPDDTLLIYHSMGQPAIVGWATVISQSRQDPTNQKSWVVDVRFGGKMPIPVTLKEIRETGLFGDWSLLRQSRLSTMAVPDAFMAWLQTVHPYLPADKLLAP